MNELISRLRNAGLIDGDSVVLEAIGSGDERCVLVFVSIEDFTQIFGAAAETGYEAMVAADDNGDGTTKGYRRYFDAWRAAGLI